MHRPYKVPVAPELALFNFMSAEHFPRRSLGSAAAASASPAPAHSAQFGCTHAHERCTPAAAAASVDACTLRGYAGVATCRFCVDRPTEWARASTHNLHNRPGGCLPRRTTSPSVNSDPSGWQTNSPYEGGGLAASTVHEIRVAQGAHKNAEEHSCCFFVVCVVPNGTKL